jgi:hypothetical protein
MKKTYYFNIRDLNKCLHRIKDTPQGQKYYHMILGNTTTQLALDCLKVTIKGDKYEHYALESMFDYALVPKHIWQYRSKTGPVYERDTNKLTQHAGIGYFQYSSLLVS